MYLLDLHMKGHHVHVPYATRPWLDDGFSIHSLGISMAPPLCPTQDKGSVQSLNLPCSPLHTLYILPFVPPRVLSFS